MTSDGTPDRGTPKRGRIGPGQYVRPVGYASPDPVVRRIGDRSLFLGNAAAADPARHDWTFDHVLSLTLDPCPLTTHHRPLVDSEAAEWRAFGAAVDAALELHRTDGSLLVHCEAGISRSSAVVATAVAAAEGRPFVDALHAVQSARPHALPNPTLHEFGVAYLAARGQQADSPHDDGD